MFCAIHVQNCLNISAVGLNLHEPAYFLQPADSEMPGRHPSLQVRIAQTICLLITAHTDAFHATDKFYAGEFRKTCRPTHIYCICSFCNFKTFKSQVLLQFSIWPRRPWYQIFNHLGLATKQYISSLGIDRLLKMPFI